MNPVFIVTTAAARCCDLVLRPRAADRLVRVEELVDALGCRCWRWLWPPLVVMLRRQLDVLGWRCTLLTPSASGNADVDRRLPIGSRRHNPGLSSGSIFGWLYRRLGGGKDEGENAEQ